MAKFRARARTVDMLGRQQIAGAPTAISELFKNAHDAYATRVEVDYYRPDNLFLLRDDGIGMTLDEFQDRWLTIGTESKVGGGVLPYRPPGVAERPVMGEKGIGRLAIARLGPQVLVMTRARRGKVTHDLVVGLVNWELFELTGVNLDEIEIPVETFSNGKLPDAIAVRKLVDQLKKSVRILNGRTSPERLARIEQSLSQFVADPQRIDAFFNSAEAIGPDTSPLTLRNDGGGTHFLIQPADDFLAAEIDSTRDSEFDPNFIKFLVGFANTMVPNAPKPKLATRFRDWNFPETATELIDGSDFLTANDFISADHHFTGRFDEFGQFEGEVRIYDEAPVRHVIPWERGQGERTECGPFSINIAHLQGASRESRLPPDDWSKLYRKLNRFGGIYLYRDGIRILPYGNSDVDWLHIETRRNKGQAYYFFAYRRIFGTVEITQEGNSNLIEKAGREGLQTNKAYRQFTEILENFLIQLAADFFRESGVKAAIWMERKSELERAEKLRRKREESVAGRRKEFADNLDKFFELIEADEPKQEIATVLNEVQQALNAAKNERNPDRAAELLITAEGYAEQRLGELRKRHSISKPRDIGFGVAIRREWEAYLSERERLETDVFAPAEQKIHETIGIAAKAATIHVDQRRRLQTLIGEMAGKIDRDLKGCAENTRQTADTKQAEVHKLAHRALTEVKDTIDKVRADLQRVDLSGLTPASIDSFRGELERKIDVAATHHRELLESVRQQLLDVKLEPDSDGGPIISAGEITGALEEEVLALREAADADAELVQLGMALAVVTHEFDAVIRAIRNELKRFKGWANATPQLKPIYERIHGNFEHLDGYLALFTPLQRRLYRKPQNITGVEIAKFIEELFEERLRRHSITLTVTTAFRARAVVGYPSTFFPIFVNLIDNAIYWLKDKRTPRTITLDADADGYLIANNGPPIAARDKESIFDLRFTKKPGGRGMGLYISRTTLAKAGYRLWLETRPEFPVCFKIAIKPDSEEETVDES